MYLYFDNNGILKEIVDDVATRKGNNEVNRLYIYVDGITPKTEWITYQTSDGVKSNEILIETTITKTIPYDRNRDLTYFKNFQEYLFYVATIPSNVLAVSGLTKASVRVALQDDSLMTLGLIIFTIEDSVVLQDSFITESQYQYLLNIISNFEELNNTGVIGISTQIVNGAVAPYDQGRIVLSTYNDKFTIATVVKNTTGQNVYNVLDMTFVEKIPYVGTNPFLEGLSINGVNYKVPSKTSQLLNDMGFVQRTVNNLSNYYNKDTIDEMLANIDLSDYYTKTESDGRYVLTTNFSWNNLANKPTSLSDFINDEGFINNTVSNLTNYYDKTTIDNIVSTLKTGAFQVVSELPSSGVEGVVYLVGTEAPYTMYIWENNAFLNIGTTDVNLDGYVKGTNLNANYVILGNGGSNVVASSYTINNQNANDPNSLLTAKVINTLLGTKQDVLTEGQGVKISDNVISTPVSYTSATISGQSVNKLKYDGKPILVDYAISDDSGRNIVDTYATFNDLHTLDIGDITSSSNIYQTLYENVYENDTTKKNVVIFSTEGSVDSVTSLISAGDHIATPYQDNEILIDSVFVLNSDNSATSIVSSDTVVIYLGTLGASGTLSREILTQIYSNLESKAIIFEGTMNGDIASSFASSNYTVLATSSIIVIGIIFLFGTVINMISITLPSGSYTHSTTILLDENDTKTINEQSLRGKGNISVQEPLVSGTNIKSINGQTILSSGNINLQERLYSGTNIKTINGQSILEEGNINTGLPSQQYTISNLNFINFSEGQTTTISASDSAIINNARSNQASVIYNEVNLQYLPLLYVEVANDIQVLYSDLLGHCGVVRINTTNNTATVLSVFKTGKNSTINLDTISSTKTNYDNVFNYLVDQGFARAYFNVEGFLDQENGIGNEQYYEAYLSGENNYFASCGKIYEYIVDTSSQGFHVELVGNSLFRPISKNTLRFKGNEILKISPTSTLTNVSILLGANVSKGHKKYTFDNPRMNFQLKPTFDNSFAFDTSTKEIDIRESIYTKLFTWSSKTDTVVPTVSSTKVSTWYPTNWHKGTVASGKITATILDFSNLPSGTTYNGFFNGFNNFPDPISFKFNSLVDKYQEYRTFRFSLRFVFDYQGVKHLTTDRSYSKKWTGTLQNKYLEVIARLDFTNKQVVIYQRIRKFA